MRSAASELNSNRNLLRLLSDLSDELLEQVLEVLKPFDTATRVLSTDKKPSLRLVLPTKYTLSRHLTPSGTDNAVITQFKTHLLAQLEKYFHVTDIHAAASLLDPRIKNKQEVMSGEVRNRAVNTVRKMVENHIVKQQSCQLDEPARKRVKLSEEAESSSSSFFGELFNFQQPTHGDDFNCYINSQGNISLLLQSF